MILNSQNAAADSKIKPLLNDRSSASLHYFDPCLTLPIICFDTDDRGFSSDLKMNNRLKTKFKLTLNPNGTGSVSLSFLTTYKINEKVHF